MTKKEIIEKLVEAGIEHNAKATNAELEKLLPVGAAPKDETSGKATSKTEERKIGKDELIQLQKEGRLAGYDPATGIGIVLSKGNKIKWPGGDPKIV